MFSLGLWGGVFVANAKRGKKCSKRGHKKLPAVTVQKKTLPFSHHSFDEISAPFTSNIKNILSANNCTADYAVPVTVKRKKSVDVLVPFSLS